MKQTLFAITLVLSFFISTSSFAQLRKIPAEVTTSFTEKFPAATEVEWRDKLSGFTASFSVDSISYIASFNNKGEWESTEQSIEADALPDVVRDGFDKSKYADWNIEDVSQIELPDNEIQFKIVIAKGDIKKRNLYLNSEGRLLKDKLTL
jgi:hypothetical protein